MGFVSDIIGSITGAIGDITGINSDVIGNLTSITDSSGVSALTSIISIVKQIDDFVKPIISAVEDVVKPIKDTTDAINNLAHDVVDGLIQPIVQPIHDIVGEISTIQKTIDADVKGGLDGILRIPQDIADAFNSVAASFDRSFRQLAEANTQISNKILGPSIHDAGAPGFKMLTDTFADFAGTHEFKVSPIDHVSLREDEVLSAMGDIYRGRIEGLTFDGSLGTGLVHAVLSVGTAISFALGVLDNMREYGRDKANELVPAVKLDPATTVAANTRGILSDADTERELAAKGFDPTRRKVLLDLAKVVLDPATLDDLLKRKIISQGDYTTSLIEQGYSEQEVGARLEALEQLFDPSTLLDLAARGAVDDANVRRILAAQGFIPEAIAAILETKEAVEPYTLPIAGLGNRLAALHGFFAETYGSSPPPELVALGAAARRSQGEVEDQWIAHWAKMPVQLAIIAYFKGLLSFTEVGYVIEQNDFPPAMANTLIDAQRPTLSRLVIRQLLASNSISVETAREQLFKEGWSADLVDALIHNAQATKAASKAATAKAAVDLSLATAESAFQDGVIDEAAYRGILAEHRLDPEAVNVTIQLAKIKAADAERKAFVGDLIAQVELGILSEADAEQQAAQAGLAPAEIVRIRRSLRSAKAKAGKLPDLAQLVRMVKASIIDRATFASTLARLGYPPEWIDRLTTLELGSA